ncbi:hypothetical protein ACS0TY_016461 [Phlomoides rotata]
MDETTEEKGHQSKVMREPARWTRPESGQTEINTNETIFQDGTFGLGFVMRNDEGNILFAGSKRFHGGGSSTLVETIALLFGLETSVLRGFTINSMETNSNRLAQSVNGTTENEPYVLAMVEDIRLWAHEVGCSMIQHIDRTTNTVVHALAHVEREPDYEEFWTSNISGSCMHFILNDEGVNLQFRLE